MENRKVDDWSNLLDKVVYLSSNVIYRNSSVTPRPSTKQNTKAELLKAGTDIMMVKGYSNTGIAEVLKSVGVPKGSFYYYFESKEDFALEIIADFDEHYREEVLCVLRDQSMSPLSRLKKYCKNSKEKLREKQCSRGCLIGNLCQEMSSQSDVLRERLYQVMAKWRDIFAACIEEGQIQGEIGKDFEASDLAEFFLSGWEGAVMRAKTTQNLKPVDTFQELMFDGILRKGL